MKNKLSSLVVIGIIAIAYLQVLTLRTIQSFADVAQSLDRPVERDPALVEMAISLQNLEVLVAHGQRLQRRLLSEIEKHKHDEADVGRGDGSDELQAGIEDDPWGFQELSQLSDDEIKSLKVFDKDSHYVRQPDGSIGMVKLGGNGDSDHPKVRTAASQLFKLTWEIANLKREMVIEEVDTGRARSFDTYQKAREYAKHQVTPYVHKRDETFFVVDVSTFEDTMDDLEEELEDVRRRLLERDVRVGVVLVTAAEDQ